MKKYLLIVLYILLLNACSNGTCSVFNTTLPPITINSAGIIPVFDNSATTTTIDIHNHSNTDIESISYTNITNVANHSSVASLNSEQCTTIKAGESCALSITTPVLTGINQQGSTTLSMNYTFNNESYTFNQLINYSIVKPVENNGATFKSGAIIFGYGYDSGYATVYLYDNDLNSDYINSITTNNNNLTITRGNISGSTLPTNTVWAVEMRSPITNNSYNAELSVQSNEQFINQVPIIIDSNQITSHLTIGLVSYIDTSITTNGTLTLQNSGLQGAYITNITAESGITIISQCTATTINLGDICDVDFTVDTPNGNGNIIITYNNDQKLVSNVSWYDSNNIALVEITTAENPIAFLANSTYSTTVTVSNIGEHEFSDINIPSPIIVSGSAIATITDDDCSGSILESGYSCSYNIEITDSMVDINKQIDLGFDATYYINNIANSYSSSMILNYSSTTNGMHLTMSPQDISSRVLGNNEESIITNVVITNQSNLDVTLNSLTLNNLPKPPFITSSTTCGQTLAPNESCISTIKVGPVFSAASYIESGITTYDISYTTASEINTQTISAIIKWSIESSALIFTDLTNSGDFNCTLGNNGAAYCFGLGQAGRIGNLAEDNQNTPTQVTMPSGKGFTQISSNPKFSCALGTNNAAYCWGVGAGGRMGNGQTNNNLRPMRVNMPNGGRVTFTSVITNSNFSCGSGNDGSTYCWGIGESGQLGNGKNKDKDTPSKVSMPNGVSIIQLSTNPNFSCAIATDNNTYCWGIGENGQLGNGLNNNLNTPIKVTLPNGVNFTHVETIDNRSCALGNDNALYCWGYGLDGEIGNGANNNVNIPTLVTPPNGVIFNQVSLGSNFTCAISTELQIYCWGNGSGGRIGNGANHNVNTPTLVTMPNGVFFTKISSGGNSSCALSTDNTSYCFGGGTNGKIGNGLNNNVNIPTASIMPNNTIFSNIIVSEYTSCALSNYSTVFCFGKGSEGQIGNGANNNVNIPTQAIMPN